eukprot:TRINITY_DN14044_c0_g1_i1.p1 TRINITY_DN14044_c0_g1~~TRINITY_DN14044_c0_g1_i1.p1  ORF type:complete len:564 (-),score=86.07 TRINITY_DN14044_c0_g1_i1:59-1750(-)
MMRAAALMSWALLLISTVTAVKVGILYEVWHTPASNGYRTILEQGHENVCATEVIQSNGTLILSDCAEKYGVDTASFLYHVKPELGYYCIYSRRATDPASTVPDCLNINSTLHTHATMLAGAGVDYVVVDGTNWPDPGEPGQLTDIFLLRPTEVLLSEWFALRSSGVATPQVAMWCPIWPASTVWKYWITLFQSDPRYMSMVVRDPTSNKPVLFVTATNVDQSILTQIDAAGWVVVQMWALLSPEQFASGVWSFFSPCRAGNQQTSSVANEPCEQLVTEKSPLGSQMSVSPSYQLNYGSVFGGAPGKLRGRTFGLQFHNVLQNQPDHLFISSFNEFVAQPQPNPSKANTAFSMGIPWDPEARNMWVDTWGSEYSRDIEPSLQRGDFDFRLMQSCLRVLRTGARSCTDSAELCCNVTQPQYNNVFASVHTVTNNHRLSLSHLDGQWREVCTPFVGPTTFCVDPSLTQGQGGPFIVWSRPPDDVAPTQVSPLYSCMAGSMYFFTCQPNCEGQQLDVQLGWLATVRTPEMPRALNRCYDRSSGVHFHSLDIACPTGQFESTLGYVR